MNYNYDSEYIDITRLKTTKKIQEDLTKLLIIQKNVNVDTVYL